MKYPSMNVQVGRNLCVLFSQLAAEATTQKRKLWKMTPKLHLFLHLCEWQAPEYGNPKFYWAYADEDRRQIFLHTQTKVSIEETTSYLPLSRNLFRRCTYVGHAKDLVGHMIEVAETCHPRTMAGTALFKWLTFAFDPE